MISAKGRSGTVELLEVIANQEDDRIPAVARFSLEFCSAIRSYRGRDWVHPEAYPCLAPIV